MENNNTKNGKKKENKEDDVPSRPRTRLVRCSRVEPKDYTTEADYVTLGKSFQFNAFSLKLPPAKIDRRLHLKSKKVITQGSLFRELTKHTC